MLIRSCLVGFTTVGSAWDTFALDGERGECGFKVGTIAGGCAEFHISLDDGAVVCFLCFIVVQSSWVISSHSMNHTQIWIKTLFRPLMADYTHRVDQLSWVSVYSMLRTAPVWRVDELPLYQRCDFQDPECVLRVPR